ncbi:MAG: ATPase [Cyanobacteria bacterium SIG30]|nr:ATPase [Cyanobacteria bacterium SIG30]
MKIAIPTINGKLCPHFGHCETFSFIEIDEETKKILKIEEKQPEEGISCQSASWVANQGVDLILAGGMGGRPMMLFAQNNIKVVTGCKEIEIEKIVEMFLEDTLETGENSCGSEGHHCHGHSEEHHCHGHSENHHCHGHH